MGISPDLRVEIRRGQQLFDGLKQGDQRAALLLIQVSEGILERLLPNNDPTLYARTQTNLGYAYYSLPTGDRAASLAQAIHCYQQALRFWKPEAAPLDYAWTQNNLGNAYGELPTGDRTSNLAQSINCYQQALRFRTPEAAPLDYAATQYNLGNAY